MASCTDQPAASGTWPGLSIAFTDKMRIHLSQPRSALNVGIHGDPVWDYQPQCRKMPTGTPRNGNGTALASDYFISKIPISRRLLPGVVAPVLPSLGAPAVVTNRGPTAPERTERRGANQAYRPRISFRGREEPANWSGFWLFSSSHCCYATLHYLRRAGQRTGATPP